MNKKPKMTIEDLAILMEKRFAEQDEKLDSLARITLTQFEIQDQKIEGVTAELREFKEGNNENFGKIRNDIFNLDNRFVTHKQAERFAVKIKTAY